jgi:Flp pilus assembly protein CpaB
MEASSVRKKIGGNWPGDSFSGRRGTLTIAVVAAVAAGVLIFLFVQQYKKNVNGTVSTSPVFVATQFIQRGTATSVIGAESLFQRTLVKSNQVLTGAISDPSAIQGEVVAKNIYPGQQLTAADFTRSNVTIGSELTGTQRAIAVPLDSAHGLVNYVHPGDYVDVLSSFPTGPGGGQGGAVTTLARRVLVLATASAGGGIGTTGGNEAILRVTDQLALAVAFAVDNGKLWLTLRPPIGATDSGSANTRATHLTATNPTGHK